MRMKTSKITLLCGAPYVGKTAYYWEHLSTNTHRVCLQQVYAQNPDLNLRQLILTYVVPFLSKLHVVIEEARINWNTLKALKDIIKGKGFDCSYHIIQLVPKHADVQLLWSIQTHKAEDILYQNQMCEEQPMKEQDIVAWSFNSHSLQEHVTSVTKIEVPLTVYTTGSFSQPSLMIEWQSVYETSHQTLIDRDSLCRSINTWYTHNEGGRVIFVLLPMATDQFGSTKEILSSIVNKLELQLPVFAIEIDNSEGFCTPPKPGILAFIQRLHHVNLRHAHTLYMYQSEAHMKMARNAGVKHIATSRVMKQPLILTHYHGAQHCSQPDFLTDLHYYATTSHPWYPNIHNTLLPFCGKLQDKCVFSVRDRWGRVHYCAASSVPVWNKYLKSTNIWTSKSNLEAANKVPLKVKEETERKAGPSKKRALPAWLKSSGETPNNKLCKTNNKSNSSNNRYSKKADLLPAHSTLSVSSQEDSSTTSHRQQPHRSSSIKQTFYMMNEAELVDVAKLMLQENT